MKKIGKLRKFIFPAWLLNLIWLTASIFIYSYTDSINHWSVEAWKSMIVLSGSTKFCISLLAAARCIELFSAGESEEVCDHDWENTGAWRVCSKCGSKR